jgi:hypothetical protein
VATRSPAERVAFTDWLNSGEFEAVPVVDLGASTKDFEALNFEMLLVDVELMNVAALMRVALYRPTPRPVLVVGDADPQAEAEAGRAGISYLVRPIERSGLLFAVTLALAEGRPMRRSPRKRVSPVPGLIDGVQTRVIDVSREGVRLSFPEPLRGSLPRQFMLRVPLFNLAITVQRIWVSTIAGATSQLCCGGALVDNRQRNTDSWRSFVEMTPALDAAPGRTG